MSAKAEPQGGAKLLIDLGPLLVFFLVNFLAPVPSVMKIFVATGAFMIAMVAAMLFSAIRYRRISPLLWFSGIMVVILGGLTIWLHDETFIKMKPTIIYVMFGGLLLGGLWLNKPLLAIVFDSVFDLTPEGWRKLTLRWATFFLALAVLNEIVWRTQSTDFWVSFKVFGVLPLTFIFAGLQFPLLQKYATTKEE